MLINNESYLNIKPTINKHNNVQQQGIKKCLLPQGSESDLLLTTDEDWPPSILRPLYSHMMILTTLSNFPRIHFRKN